MDFKHWSAETDDDGVVWLRLDKADSGVNVLSTEVMTELGSLVEGFRTSPPAGLVIYSGKETGFVMGADINEFTAIDSTERAYEVTRLGQDLFSAIENLPCPSVAVLDGFALGGGLELAMACHYRLAIESPKRVLGLPEVQLGLHPGFGGTVRAIRLCGVRPGMQLMLTGAPITVDKAQRTGLVDRVSARADWRDQARQLVATRPARQRPPLVERLLNLAPVRPLLKPVLVRQVAARARRDHYPAPYAMIDLWVRHGASPKSGYEAEARSFAELMCTSTSRNLVRVFFLQNKLKNQGNKIDRRIERVHVVGAGVMGGDIAAWCALRGLDVSLQDREQKYIEPAIKRARALFDKKIRDDNERQLAAGRLKPDVAGEGAARADLIIEAIFENRDAKRELYAGIEKIMRADAVLATNTSTIPLEELRVNLRAPTRFIGLHFFNPVAKMPLVEVVRTEDSDQDALDLGFAFVRHIGKFPLECASAPGFVVNRILAPYITEAMRLVADGVPMPVVDRAAEDFGMPMGPVELADSVGLDVVLHSSEVLGGAEGEAADALREKVDAGKLGRKSGEGFYRWENGKAVKPSAEGRETPPDLEDRLVLPMVNEAVACLADGIVSDADLLDAGVIFGTGFAPFRGGPLNYARERGIGEVIARLEELEKKYGERFAPHRHWSEI